MGRIKEPPSLSFQVLKSKYMYMYSIEKYDLNLLDCLCTYTHHIFKIFDTVSYWGLEILLNNSWEVYVVVMLTNFRYG